MSLIRDALNEAQRERQEKIESASASIDNTTPSSTPRGVGQRRLGTILIVAGVVTSGATAAGAFVLRARTSFAASPTATAKLPRPPVLVPVIDSVVLPSPSQPALADTIAKPVAVSAPATAATAPADVAPSIPLPVKQPPAPIKSSTPVRPPASVLIQPRRDSARVQRPAAVTVASTVPETPAGTVRSPAVLSGDSLFKLAYAEHLRGNLDGAYELYEKAIATKRAPAEAYNDLGVLLGQRGDLAAATEMFRQAVTRDDANADAWVNLGDSHAAANRHSEAMSAFARAGQLDPARIAVKTRLATQYQAIGDTATARQFFTDAVRLDPTEASAHYSLGMFLQTQHELPGAIREFQRFVELAGSKYSPDTIAEMKEHIVALRRFVP